MRYLQISFCSGQIKETQLPKDEAAAIGIWKELGDELLKNLPTKAFGLAPGHVVRISVIKTSDLDPNDPGELELSVYRTCSDIEPPCPYSSPKKNEPKLYVTGGQVA